MPFNPSVLQGGLQLRGTLRHLLDLHQTSLQGTKLNYFAPKTGYNTSVDEEKALQQHLMASHPKDENATAESRVQLQIVNQLEMLLHREDFTVTVRQFKIRRRFGRFSYPAKQFFSKYLLSTLQAKHALTSVKLEWKRRKTFHYLLHKQSCNTAEETEILFYMKCHPEQRPGDSLVCYKYGSKRET